MILHVPFNKRLPWYRKCSLDVPSVKYFLYVQLMYIYICRNILSRYICTSLSLNIIIIYS